MILTRECLDIPMSRDYSALLLPYVARAEEEIWKEPQKTEVSDDGKLVISYLLFSRMEDILSRGPHSFYEGQPYFTRMEPVLAAMAADYAVLIRELLDTLHRESGRVSGLLGGPWTRVERVLDCGGDLHNRGRCTLVVETDGGKVVYKPRDCGIDRWFAALADRYCGEYLRVPRVEAGEGWGLFEYVECTEEAGETGAYAYSLGRFCALARMLGSVDMHRENLLFRDGRLVPVDLETVLAPRERLDFFQRSTGSVYTPEEYERLQTSLRPSALLTLAGERFGESSGDGGEGLRQLEAGFAAEYRRIMENRALFARELRAAAPCRVRTVIRSTREYEAMLDLLFGGTEAGEAELLRRLREDTVPSLEAVCAHELAALKRGDIPYFYAEAGSGDIRCGGETAVPGFFAASAVAQALRRLETAGEEELCYELDLLRQTQAPSPSPASEEKSLTIPDDLR